VLLADHRAAHEEPAHRGEKEQVDQRLALGAHAGGVEPLAQLLPRQRPLLGERPPDRLQGTLGFRLAHTLLAQSAFAGGEQRRRGQPLQQRIVLAADQVQRAAVEPADDQLPLGQRPLDVGRAQPLGPRPHREAEAARVLALNGKQTPGDGRRIGEWRAAEALRREALGEDGLWHGGNHPDRWEIGWSEITDVRCQ